ncbi:16S rRNA (uracil(1498)-N(3))-methyltransferase [Ferriphaselus sp. R-1]|uniref:16S rRNA (uracil(1498)-N(3))-methyltransferase n=1 Tax=Ferriphaselus sp. R-1 TaxID=1485544 RepID=UPI0005544883|nr:16S rRNA (uracil(1498)-N(3))-methyltransferase [Ferriphaselus sp. R-1]
MPRFYCPPPLPHADHCELPPEAAHHASRVLRLRAGDAVQLFDGEGAALDARIREIVGKHVWLEGLRPLPPEASPPLHIILAQAMSGSDKMDWVVQKATELGAAEIQPVQTQRSVAKLSSERAEKRGEHWRGVTLAACEQCGRNTLPLLHPPQELSQWLAQLPPPAADERRFILLPDGATMLAAQPRPQGRATLLIGPEGGFTPEEAQMARAVGFTPILLGPRVLRTETAAIAAIAALQILWGDLN